jgi:hypothetical protein
MRRRKSARCEAVVRLCVINEKRFVRTSNVACCFKQNRNRVLLVTPAFVLAWLTSCCHRWLQCPARSTAPHSLPASRSQSLRLVLRSAPDESGAWTGVLHRVCGCSSAGALSPRWSTLAEAGTSTSQ